MAEAIAHPGLAALNLIYETKTRDCTDCRHHRNRVASVFGYGATESPPFAFVGDGATTAESESGGYPFVGDEGLLLDNLLEKLGTTRGEVYLAQATCCPPTRGRSTTPPHIESCLPHVVGQMRAVRPRCAIALGRRAGLALTGMGSAPMGAWLNLQMGIAKTEVPVPVMVIYSLKEMLDTRLAEKTRGDSWRWLLKGLDTAPWT